MKGTNGEVRAGNRVRAMEEVTSKKQARKGREGEGIRAVGPVQDQTTSAFCPLASRTHQMKRRVLLNTARAMTYWMKKLAVLGSAVRGGSEGGSEAEGHKRWDRWQHVHVRERVWTWRGSWARAHRRCRPPSIQRNTAPPHARPLARPPPCTNVPGYDCASSSFIMYCQRPPTHLFRCAPAGRKGP